MASSSQHRCVFVGNIPYDATEEQLVQICEEVGPVVSFRLVLDRETGKPKGYGFCEYKDEETALSARRNLQGYEINGRQLRVDFAENDKGTDRTREQGRGGPGSMPNVDAQKISSAPLVGGSSIHQPIGLPLASNAASIMAEALGGVQTSNIPYQIPSGLRDDPLTLHLAKMTRNQLYKIMSEMKALVSKDKVLALRLLQTCPQLSKALFQSQIMFGMVTQQMLQTHTHQPGSFATKSQFSNEGQSVSLSHSAQTPVLQTAAQIGLYNQSGPQDNQMPMLPQNLVTRQQPHIQPSYQPLSSSIQPPTLPVMKGTVPVPPRPVTYPNMVHHDHSLSAFPNTNIHQPTLPHLPPSQNESLSYMKISGPQEISGPQGESVEAASYTSLGYGSVQGARPHLVPTSATTSLEQMVMGNDAHDPALHPSKLARMEDGSRVPQNISSINYADRSFPNKLSVSDLGLTDQVDTTIDDKSDKQAEQILPDAEAALLKQVMSLTAEQVNSLPPEQRQQVIQLQQMLRS